MTGTDSSELAGSRPGSAPGGFARRAEQIIAAVLLAIMGLTTLSVVARKSITVDEIVMIPAAYYHVAKGNFDLNRDNPPAYKVLAALPLLALNLRTIEPNEAGAPPQSSPYEWVHVGRFWEDNKDK